MLQEWANSVEKHLGALCEITEETLKTNKGEEPQNYKQLIADLKDAENVRKKEAEILGERAASPDEIRVPLLRSRNTLGRNSISSSLDQKSSKLCLVPLRFPKSSRTLSLVEPHTLHLTVT